MVVVTSKDANLTKAHGRYLESKPVFRLQIPKLGVDAKAQQIDGEFTMLTGSLIVGDWHGVGKADSTIKAYDSYRAQHQKLIADGAVVVDGGRGRLTRGHRFRISLHRGGRRPGTFLQRPDLVGVR